MPGRRTSITALLLAAATMMLAQSAPKHGMTLDDLQKLQRVGAPVVSPDGAWVAYTLSHVNTEEDKNQSDLWMVSWDGKQDVQLTYEKEGAGAPRWSPDGKLLAFTSSRAGKAKGDQVWVMYRRGGEAYQLTEVKQDLKEYRWSPDAKQLLLTLQEKEEPEPEKKSDKPVPPKPVVIDRYHFKQDKEGFLTEKHPQLYLFDVATKKLTKLTNDTAHAENAAEWSPDGSMVAYTSNFDRDPDRTENSDVFVVEAKAGATPKKLTSFAGPDVGPLQWTRDGKEIVYRQGSEPKFNAYNLDRLAVVPATGGDARVLTEALDRGVGAPVLAPDGRSVLVAVADDRVEYVAEMPLGGGAAKRLTREPGTAMELNAAGGHTALLWTTDTAAPEVYALDGGELRKLTGHNDALLGAFELAKAEDITAHGKDGTEVHGLLTRPLGAIAAGKYPLLLRIHGGPNGQDAHAFTMERQLFAAHGYGVLNVNYRGSAGRGHAYGESIFADWGNKEVADLLASVDEVVRSDGADEARLGIGGWSYGGILTDYTIASDGRFKAASSGASSANQISMYGIDQYVFQYDNEVGPPWKSEQAWIKLSYPFFHADRIHTPTLFMGGDQDANVPLVGTEQMYQALKSIGIPTELVVYPGQFHGFTRPSFIRDRYQRWFDWYDRYLMPAKGTPAPAAAQR